MANERHRIRLRGFWQRRPHDGPGVCLERSFGFPAQTDPDASWWLTGAAFPCSAILRIVPHDLATVGASESWEVRLASDLPPRNRLQVVLAEDLPWAEELFLVLRANSEPASGS